MLQQLFAVYSFFIIHSFNDSTFQDTKASVLSRLSQLSACRDLYSAYASRVPDPLYPEIPDRLAGLDAKTRHLGDHRIPDCDTKLHAKMDTFAKLQAFHDWTENAEKVLRKGDTVLLSKVGELFFANFFTNFVLQKFLSRFFCILQFVEIN